MTTASRRLFLRAVPGVCLAPTLVQAAPALRRDGYAYGVFPQQDAELVKSIVGESHRSLENVKALLDRRPQLANAGWDWGFGDWETALGAASHTGRREIAELLIGHGARPDLFTHAMLGNLAAVRALTEAHHALRRLKGPHGINLMDHAKAGGPDAAAVVEYLSAFPDASEPRTGPALSETERAVYVGVYASADGVGFEIKVVRDALAFQLGEQSPRGLSRVGPHEFHPVVRADVRLKFTVAADRAESVEITGPEPILAAQRTA